MAAFLRRVDGMHVLYTLIGVPMHSHSPSPCSLQYNNLGDDDKKAIEKAAGSKVTVQV